MTGSTQDTTIRVGDDPETTGFGDDAKKRQSEIVSFMGDSIDGLQRVLDDLMADMGSSTGGNHKQESILDMAQMLRERLNKTSRECTTRVEHALEKLDSSAEDPAAHDKASHRARLKELRTTVIREYFTAMKTISIMDAYLRRATGSSVAEEVRPKEDSLETRMVKVLLDVASQDFPASVKATLNEIDAGSAKFA